MIPEQLYKPGKITFCLISHRKTCTSTFILVTYLGNDMLRGKLIYDIYLKII